jgi:hypothetical protein
MTVDLMHQEPAGPIKVMLPITSTGSLKAGCSPFWQVKRQMAMSRLDSAANPQFLYIDCMPMSVLTPTSWSV